MHGLLRVAQVMEEQRALAMGLLAALAVVATSLVVLRARAWSHASAKRAALVSFIIAAASAVLAYAMSTFGLTDCLRVEGACVNGGPYAPVHWLAYQLLRGTSLLTALLCVMLSARRR